MIRFFLLKNRTALSIISLTALLAGYSAHWIYFNRVVQLDWSYFSSLSLVVKSIVLATHSFPLRDPWVAGGLDLLANPQSRIFSPYVFLDLTLDPYQANLISLLLGGVIGMMGMFSLTRLLGATSVTACLCAIIFINSSWFGNHFAEGHIPFNSFQLVPWLLYLLFKQQDRRTLPLLCLLCSFWILDGGIYTFIFSLPLILALRISGLIRFRAFLQPSNSYSLAAAWIFFSCFAFLLLTSPKIIPVLGLNMNRTPHIDFTTMSIPDLLISFFNPLQSPLYNMTSGTPWRMHEYGCYLGTMVLVLAWGSVSGTFDKRAWRFLLVAGFFLWTGSGWGGDLNPWHLFAKIPLLNNAHVQSRVFIFTYLLAILSAIGPLNHLLQSKHWVSQLIFWGMILEFTAAKAYPAYSTFKGASRPRPSVTEIPDGGIDETVPFAQKPDHYFSGRKSSVLTYEPAAIRTAVRASHSEGYRGEAWIAKGAGDISILHHGPSRIVLKYDLPEHSVVTFNTNYLLGWEANNADAGAISNELGLLTAEIPPGRGVLDLSYTPWYFELILVSFFIGISLSVWLLLFKARKVISGAYDYSQIPLGYYDEVFYTGPSVQRAWHVQKFDRVRDVLPDTQNQAILDIGCFSGTFLSTLSEKVFSQQLGVDILETQVNYARQRYETGFRKFYCIDDISNIQHTLDLPKHSLDCVTSIEVIEHLPPAVIKSLFNQAHRILKPGGRLIITTPNYLSAWPLIEFLLNYLSPTSYAEQHITKFTWLNLQKKLKSIYPEFDHHFEIELKTSTHFIAPFLAPLSFAFSRAASRSIDHRKWKFPFGNLMLVVLVTKNESKN